MICEILEERSVIHGRSCLGSLRSWLEAGTAGTAQTGAAAGDDDHHRDHHLKYTTMNWQSLLTNNKLTSEQDQPYENI